MILINFSHPITKEQKKQIKSMIGKKTIQIIDVPSQFDQNLPFADQVRALVDGIALSPEAWQKTPLLINPPSYNFAAMVMLAELHGRMGYFPAIIRIRPIPDSVPMIYEIAEIINLQSIREFAREQR